MRISSIYIDGYRRFKAQNINFEDGTTILAGANNSGKTSLIDLLRVVLGGEGSLHAEDLSASARHEWFKALVDAAVEGEDAYRGFLEQEDLLEQVPAVDVCLEVTYDRTSDDIREFADYLMDLDSTKSSFYFQFRFSARRDGLMAAYVELYPDIKKTIDSCGWTSANDAEPGSSAFLVLQAKVDASLVGCSRPEVFFADESYTNVLPIGTHKNLKHLINFRAVKASRTLDDINEDKSGGLNQRLIEVAKEDENWLEILSKLPDQVLSAIQGLKIREVTANEALKSLNTVIESISNTNGSRQNDLFLDFHVTEDHAIQMIARAMQTRYLGAGVPLGEASQGLGYSNLIYLHLEAESFIRSAASEENGYLVNLLVLEEPESHMHPQMQSAFIKHLLSRVEKVGGLQAAVTTHSSEIVRSSRIEQLRVLKSEDHGCRIVDLRDFHKAEIAGKSSETQRLFSFLYAINFSDLLFADKVIMYEGDTERMYIQALIRELPELSSLRAQYISYVQVGGAYAHVYKPLVVDALRLKTVVITDLDYDKSSITSSVDELNALHSTNATLNALFNEESAAADPENVNTLTIENLLAKVAPDTGVALISDTQSAAVAFQSGREGYARTFEEAILAVLLDTDVWSPRTQDDWKHYRKDSGLRFSIPREPESPTIREIVLSTSNQKTDFMYSLLLNPELMKKVPPYISSALRWLNS
ncbi:putative ATP-dependent endonuclease of the OLDfamily [Streptococcus pneumoniae]|nr:putative ATP-dependent endonuclease of the OLDfamily [Streptococcus pneumoniae]